MSTTDTKISFILPGPAAKFFAGLAVIYEYAKHLAQKGYHIHLIHPIKTPQTSYRLPYFVRYLYYKLLNGGAPYWFSFDETIDNISISIVGEVSSQTLPDADIIIASNPATAYAISNIPPSKGKKIYLIQGHENWVTTDEEYLNNTYRLGFINITISEWLAEIVRKAGGKVAAVIPNGIDHNIFKIKIPPEARNPYSISFMYHPAEFKGARDILSALQIVRNEFQDKLQVSAFSVYKKPSNFPLWINFIHKPSRQQLADEIYNRSAIFVNASHQEGFCLPLAEAMSSGCAAVTVDSGGIREYAQHQFNALISPPEDISQISKNVLTLIKDSTQRIMLARQASETLKKFTWQTSGDKLEKIIRETI